MKALPIAIIFLFPIIFVRDIHAARFTKDGCNVSLSSNDVILQTLQSRNLYFSHYVRLNALIRNLSEDELTPRSSPAYGSEPGVYVTLRDPSSRDPKWQAPLPRVGSMEYDEDWTPGCGRPYAGYAGSGQALLRLDPNVVENNSFRMTPHGVYGTSSDQTIFSRDLDKLVAYIKTLRFSDSPNHEVVFDKPIPLRRSLTQIVLPVGEKSGLIRELHNRGIDPPIGKSWHSMIIEQDGEGTEEYLKRMKDSGLDRSLRFTVPE